MSRVAAQAVVTAVVVRAAGDASTSWRLLRQGLFTNFLIQSLFFLAAFVLLVAPLARWRPRPTIERSLQAFAGLLFIGLATRLTLSNRP